MARYKGKRVLPPPPWKKPLLLFWVAALLASGGFLGRDMYRSHRERTAYRELAQRVHRVEGRALPAAAQGEALPLAERAPAVSPYEELSRENPDFAGWLLIEGAGVDHPVMYTPREPEYYLRRAFDGSEAVGGSLFVGEGCTPDGEHVIIYGHNMHDGSMFGSLEQYADAEYAAAHLVIRFDTPDRTGEFRVLAAFYSHAHIPGEEGFRYYRYTDLSQPEDFEEYVRKAGEEALYDTGIEPSYGCRLLTLSTCSPHRDNGTFVVVAAEDGEDPDPADH